MEKFKTRYDKLNSASRCGDGHHGRWAGGDFLDVAICIFWHGDDLCRGRAGAEVSCFERREIYRWPGVLYYTWPGSEDRHFKLRDRKSVV